MYIYMYYFTSHMLCNYSAQSQLSVSVCLKSFHENKTIGNLIINIQQHTTRGILIAEHNLIEKMRYYM